MTAGLQLRNVLDDLRAAFASWLARVVTRLANSTQDWAERECIRAGR